MGGLVKKFEQEDKAAIYSGAVVGALGSAYQNIFACVDFLKDISSLAAEGLWSLASSFGGVCGGAVNMIVNFPLLEEFVARESYTPAAHVKGWNKIKYYLGMAIFIGTGILFGTVAFSFGVVVSAPFLVSVIGAAWFVAMLAIGYAAMKYSKNTGQWDKVKYGLLVGFIISTALLLTLTGVIFGPVGLLAVITMIAGFSVALIMIAQELETWLKGFDKDPSTQEEVLDEKEMPKPSKIGKWLGIFISIGNVLALSLLFTFGLATFLQFAGVAAIPAVICGLVIAFTVGAFTEYYFYTHFLAKFCGNAMSRWQDLRAQKDIWKQCLGILSVLINAAVNAATTYAGIALLTTLLTSASVGMAGIPFGIMVAAAICAGLASFILGSDFWIDNASKIVNWFKGDFTPPGSKINNDKTQSLVKHDSLAAPASPDGSNSSLEPLDSNGTSAGNSPVLGFSNGTGTGAGGEGADAAAVFVRSAPVKTLSAGNLLTGIITPAAESTSYGATSDAPATTAAPDSSDPNAALLIKVSDSTTIAAFS